MAGLCLTVPYSTPVVEAKEEKHEGALPNEGGGGTRSLNVA